MKKKLVALTLVAAMALQRLDAVIRPIRRRMQAAAQAQQKQAQKRVHNCKGEYSNL